MFALNRIVGVLAFALVLSACNNRNSSVPPSVSEVNEASIEETVDARVQATLTAEHVSNALINNTTSAPATPISQAAIASVESSSTLPRISFEYGGVRQYTTGADLIFIGILTNTSNIPVHNIQIVVSLLDAQGKVVAVADLDSPDIDVVPSGSIYPFRLRVKNAPPGQNKTDWQVYSEPYNPSADFILPRYFEVSIDNTSIRDGQFDRKIVSGQVTNRGSRQTYLIELIILFFDKKNQLVDIQSGYPKLTELLSGQSSPYEITIFTLEPSTVNYRMMVQASAKT